MIFEEMIEFQNSIQEKGLELRLLLSLHSSYICFLVNKIQSMSPPPSKVRTTCDTSDIAYLIALLCQHF